MFLNLKMQNDAVLHILRRTTSVRLTPVTRGQTKEFNRSKIKSLGT